MIIEDALFYAGRGFRVFPCKNKKPITRNGLKDGTTNTDTIQAWWKAYPDAQIAIVTGEDSGVWVLDLDRKPDMGRDGIESLALLEKQHGELPETVMAQTQSGGTHIYFRWNAQTPVRNSASIVGPAIDVRGEGGYVIAPPSPGYDWEHDITEYEIAHAPDWLYRLILQARSDKPIIRSEMGAINEGDRDDILTSFAGVARAAGGQECEIHAFISAINQNRCSPLLPPQQIAKIARSVAKYPPRDAWASIVNPRHREEMNCEEIERPKRKHDNPGEIPEDLLNPTGYLGKIIDYTNRTSHRPQPCAALAMATTLIGMMASRRFRSPTDIRTNMYTVFICESGGGKEHARKAAKQILCGAGLERLLGSESFASDSGLVNSLAAQGNMLFLLDEIGRLMKSITGESAARSPHLQNIARELLQLYSSASSIYKAKCYADASKNPAIKQPACCIYGTTVRRSFFDSLTPENMTDGLIGRFMFFVSESNRPPKQEPVLEEPPTEITEWLARLDRSLTLIRDQEPQPIIMEYTPDAKALMDQYESKIETMAATSDDGERGILNRAVENATKLALVHAVSAEHTHIDEQDAQWATRLGEHIIRTMLYVTEGRLWENKIEHDRSRILDIIRNAGKDGISRRDLGKSTRWLPKRQRDETLDAMQESGEIQIREVKGDKGGPTGIRYFG